MWEDIPQNFWETQSDESWRQHPCARVDSDEGRELVASSWNRSELNLQEPATVYLLFAYFSATSFNVNDYWL